MKTISWIEKRTYLNHDVLCNQVLTELAAVQGSPSRVEPNRLAVWLQRINEYRDLINMVPKVLDASKIVDTNHFACWTKQNRVFWKPLFKDIFWSCNYIFEKVDDLNKLLSLCEDKARDLMATPKERRVQKQVTELERELRCLSRLISSLPHPF